MQRISLPHKFIPRDYQIPFLQAMDSGFRRACLVWHRRSGKDKTALNFTINEMFKRVGTYCYFFPTLKQGRKVIWMGMDFDGFRFINHFPKELIARKREDEMMIEATNGSIFYVAGSDNFDAVMGTNPVGLIMSEYALQDPRAWDFFRPIVRENKGWVIFLYTPRGKNHGYHVWERAGELPDTWFRQLLTVDNTLRPDGTPVLTPQDMAQERAEGMDEDMLQQEYYCSFTGGMAGQIYGKLMTAAREEGRIREVPHNPNIPVYTFWDIGVRDPTSAWFMQFPDDNQINVIRYYEDEGEGVGFYIRYLENLRMTEGYVYSEHYAPHDMANRGFGTGKSPQELASDLHYNFIPIERTRNIQHGIQNARALLPRCHFDAKNCKLGIDALENYCKEWDAKWKRYSDLPRHDWACHGADAFRTFAEGMRFKSGGGISKEQAEALRERYLGGSRGGPLDDDRDDFFDERLSF